MARKPALLESLFPVSTLLKADCWELALREVGYWTSLRRFRKAFAKVSMSDWTLSLSHSYSPCNHFRTPKTLILLFPNILQKFL